MRHLMPVKEARQQLGGISQTMFYALVKEGELSLVKIGSRSFVQAEDLDDFVRRRRSLWGAQTLMAIIDPSTAIRWRRSRSTSAK